MADRMEPQDDRERFEAYYTKDRTQIKRLIQIAALGTDLGLNGYTTVEEAETLVASLGLKPDSCLLDIGAGRGWPGSHIAKKSSCKLVSTDIPWEALTGARDEIEESDFEGCRQVVNADGRALPFRSESFDGIVHADVF